VRREVYDLDQIGLGKPKSGEFAEKVVCVIIPRCLKLTMQLKIERPITAQSKILCLKIPVHHCGVSRIICIAMLWLANDARWQREMLGISSSTAAAAWHENGGRLH